jgi:XTP/dITP diphosphohydrolase
VSEPPTPEGTPRVVLVETAEAFPGLLPFQAWDVLGTAPVVWVGDAEAHPSAPHLYFAGLDLRTVEPATLDRTDLDLTRPGDPASRRRGKALLQLAEAEGEVVYLLGPGDEDLAPSLAGMATERDVEIELVFLAQQPAGGELVRLVEVMRRLRDPEHGCPWDLEQDHRTLRRYLVEEAYELLHAIEEGDDDDLAEELGDVLLQVLFHAQVARDRDAFSIDDVARGIADKLVRRHPHVFADGDAATAEEVQANWDRLKAQEKGRTSPFEGVPDAAPGLHLLEQLQRKAGKHGLEAVPDPHDALRAATDALADADGDATALVGRLLAAAVATARTHGVDPEEAARVEARRFRAEAERRLS